MGKSLVIVESPTKARTIEKYLPKGYVVRSSMGHVRDLPKSKSEIPKAYQDKPWAEISVNYENEFEPIYIISRGKKKVIDELKKELKDADELILATDEDREGESISWHLTEILKPKVPVRRMVFHEITPEAIQAALAETREIDENLVRAQETRRVLDRLVGYTVSPLLWKKIGGQLSAGRVQSAAVKLLVDRERERLRFRTGSFWDLRATLARQDIPFDARLHAVDGTRIATGKDFDEQTGRLKEGAKARLLDEAQARELARSLETAAWTVLEVKEKPETRRPAPPFITSTLQQEANRKLNLSARRTMQIAQDLYQRGFITYMRTDSPVLSDQAIRAARHWVESEYGKDFLSPKPRQFKPKAATNAQEAHEAIRPAGDRFKAPRETGLSGEELKLYELIWKRTVASQMADAKQTQITVRIEAANAEFRATGKRIDFPGFFRAYVEGSDDPDAALEDQEKPLPPLAAGDTVDLQSLEAVAHETKPPARYTEASLVRALEEKGIGRPSTYASILGTIIDRGYVRAERKALIPTLKAFAVTQLLEQHFPELVDLDFTRDMENVLDRIAAGEADWLPYLRDFYNGPTGLRTIASQREAEIDVQQARQIELPDLAPHEVRIGRFGAYAVVHLDDGNTVNVNLPDELSPDQLTPEFLRELAEQKASG
ncbi:MAG: type I DNA topoisomerase, partial [Candidatus Dadabacteria bacterium]